MLTSEYLDITSVNLGTLYIATNSAIYSKQKITRVQASMCWAALIPARQGPKKIVKQH